MRVSRFCLSMTAHCTVVRFSSTSGSCPLMVALCTEPKPGGLCGSLAPDCRPSARRSRCKGGGRRGVLCRNGPRSRQPFLFRSLLRSQVGGANGKSDLKHNVGWTTALQLLRQVYRPCAFVCLSRAACGFLSAPPFCVLQSAESEIEKMAILPEAWVPGLNRHRFRLKSREPGRRAGEPGDAYRRPERSACEGLTNGRANGSSAVAATPPSSVRSLNPNTGLSSCAGRLMSGC
jgi:hypothetical protein